MPTLLGNLRVQLSMRMGLRVFRKHYTPAAEWDRGCGLGTKAENKGLRKIVKLNQTSPRSRCGFPSSRDIYRIRRGHGGLVTLV